MKISARNGGPKSLEFLVFYYQVLLLFQSSEVLQLASSYSSNHQSILRSRESQDIYIFLYLIYLILVLSLHSLQLKGVINDPRTQNTGVDFVFLR